MGRGCFRRVLPTYHTSSRRCQKVGSSQLARWPWKKPTQQDRSTMEEYWCFLFFGGLPSKAIPGQTGKPVARSPRKQQTKGRSGTSWRRNLQRAAKKQKIQSAVFRTFGYPENFPDRYPYVQTSEDRYSSTVAFERKIPYVLERFFVVDSRAHSQSHSAIFFDWPTVKLKKNFTPYAILSL